MEKLVQIPVDGVWLEGMLGVPDGATGLVLFAHGSGSSRKSPRNNFVASELRKAGLATLLMDLLTAGEEMDYEKRFDIGLLGTRLDAAVKWAAKEPETKALRPGYFGASTGAAAALMSAASFGDRIGAVVSRGGRPDLAMEFLPLVKSPTLLIVGGEDAPVVGFNTRALRALSAEKQMAVVPGATHLFEEPGALEQVASLAASWFKKHLEPLSV